MKIDDRVVATLQPMIARPLRRGVVHGRIVRPLPPRGWPYCVVTDDGREVFAFEDEIVLEQGSLL